MKNPNLTSTVTNVPAERRTERSFFLRRAAAVVIASLALVGAVDVGNRTAEAVKSVAVSTNELFESVNGRALHTEDLENDKQLKAPRLAGDSDSQIAIAANPLAALPENSDALADLDDYIHDQHVPVGGIIDVPVVPPQLLEHK